MLCLQETKKEIVDKIMCQAIWGDKDISLAMQPANNSAGGILCIWNVHIFKLERKHTETGFIYLEGTLVSEGVKVNIVNVYSPCDVILKDNLWEQIRQIRNANMGGLWCILGDFNNIRRPMERVGSSQTQHHERSIKEFNDWISDLEVDDVPCIDRKYTWYRSNGTAKSRLDRFLVSADWLNKWKDTSQFILQRNFSDHCPLLLRSSNVDWGPKPFWVLDCWVSG